MHKAHSRKRAKTFQLTFEFDISKENHDLARRLTEPTNGRQSVPHFARLAAPGRAVHRPGNRAAARRLGTTGGRAGPATSAARRVSRRLAAGTGASGDLPRRGQFRL